MATIPLLLTLRILERNFPHCRFVLLPGSNVGDDFVVGDTMLLEHFVCLIPVEYPSAEMIGNCHDNLCSCHHLTFFTFFAMGLMGLPFSTCRNLLMIDLLFVPVIAEEIIIGDFALGPLPVAKAIC